MSEETTNVEAEIAELRAALKNANDEAASFRHKNKELTAELETQTAASAKLKQSLVQSKIASELEAQGITNARYASLISIDQLEFDDEGNPTNIAERVGELKEIYPEASTKRRTIVNVDASDKAPANKVLTSAERMLKQAQS